MPSNLLAAGPVQYKARAGLPSRDMQTCREVILDERLLRQVANRNLFVGRQSALLCVDVRDEVQALSIPNPSLPIRDRMPRLVASRKPLAPRSSTTSQRARTLRRRRTVLRKSGGVGRTRTDDLERTHD